jgi:hypothetical protein
MRTIKFGRVGLSDALLQMILGLNPINVNVDISKFEGRGWYMHSDFFLLLPNDTSATCL